MVHIALHFIVPILIALLFYRPNWKRASLYLLAGLLIDIDHLWATPVYDPGRCSIGFHPLHTAGFIGLYGLLFLSPWLYKLFTKKEQTPLLSILHLIGLGLLIHIALDGIDCLVMG